ncbi:MAG: Lrp/AsnC ligand binding domain-containing protein [Thermoplasmatales archaeon]
MINEGKIVENAAGPVVTAMVHIKADTSKIEQISSSLAQHSYVEDIYLVTGAWDMILKVRFPDIGQMRNFIIKDLRNVEGVKDSYTSMVITIFKDRGVKFQ